MMPYLWLTQKPSLLVSLTHLRLSLLKLFEAKQITRISYAETHHSELASGCGSYPQSISTAESLYLKDAVPQLNTLQSKCSLRITISSSKGLLYFPTKTKLRKRGMPPIGKSLLHPCSLEMFKMELLPLTPVAESPCQRHDTIEGVTWSSITKTANEGKKEER